MKQGVVHRDEERRLLWIEIPGFDTITRMALLPHSLIMAFDMWMLSTEQWRIILLWLDLRVFILGAGACDRLLSEVKLIELESALLSQRCITGCHLNLYAWLRATTIDHRYSCADFFPRKLIFVCHSELWYLQGSHSSSYGIFSFP